MPFYEYQCNNCDHRLEVLQKMSDVPLVYCPECNEAALKKLISAAAFRLKGTGWYETDFKNSDKKKGKSDSSPDSGATPAGNGTGKPAKEKPKATESGEAKSVKPASDGGKSKSASA